MAFEAVLLAPDIYHLQSGANSGLIVAGEQAIVIDAGLDDDAGKKIRRTIESLHLTLAALIITHAHADHFGGAHYLRRTLPTFTVYAPPLEAAIIENPLLEGIMLSGGALPFAPLTGKFTLAQPCKVDQVIDPQATTLTIAGIELGIVRLHGHSPEQIGIQYKNVLFTADAFLPIETLEKHPIPFTAHIESAMYSFNTLFDYAGKSIFAPGHGVEIKDEQTANNVIETNRVRLDDILAYVDDCIRNTPSTEADITFKVAAKFGTILNSPVSYYLARTTIQAAIVELYNVVERVQVIAPMTDNVGRLVWKAVV